MFLCSRPFRRVHCDFWGTLSRSYKAPYTAFHSQVSQRSDKKNKNNGCVCEDPSANNSNNFKSYSTKGTLNINQKQPIDCGTPKQQTTDVFLTLPLLLGGRTSLSLEGYNALENHLSVLKSALAKGNPSFGNQSSSSYPGDQQVISAYIHTRKHGVKAFTSLPYTLFEVLLQTSYAQKSSKLVNYVMEDIMVLNEDVNEDLYPDFHSSLCNLLRISSRHLGASTSRELSLCLSRLLLLPRFKLQAPPLMNDCFVKILKTFMEQRPQTLASNSDLLQALLDHFHRTDPRHFTSSNPTSPKGLGVKKIPSDNLTWNCFLLIRTLAEERGKRNNEQYRELIFSFIQMLNEKGIVDASAFLECPANPAKLSDFIRAVLVRACVNLGWLSCVNNLLDNRGHGKLSDIGDEVYFNNVLATFAPHAEYLDSCLKLIDRILSWESGFSFDPSTIRSLCTIACTTERAHAASDLFFKLSGSARNERSSKEANDYFSAIVPERNTLMWFLQHVIEGRNNRAVAEQLAQEILRRVRDGQKGFINQYDRPRIVLLYASKGYREESRQLWELFVSGPEPELVTGHTQCMLSLVKLFAGRRPPASVDMMAATALSEMDDTLNDPGLGAEFAGAEDSKRDFRFAMMVYRAFESAKQPLIGASHHDLNAIANACYTLGLLGRGTKAFQRLLKRKDIPDVADLNVMLGEMARRDVGRAEEMLVEMMRARMNVDLHSFSAVISGALENTELGIASRVYERSLRLGMKELTPRAGSALLNAILDEVSPLVGSGMSETMEGERQETKNESKKRLHESLVRQACALIANEKFASFPKPTRVYSRLMNAARRFRDATIMFHIWRVLMLPRLNCTKDEKQKETLLAAGRFVAGCVRQAHERGEIDTGDAAAMLRVLRSNGRKID